ncbi:MAG: pirin family protein [Acidimicrobiia bacterium]
MRELRDAAAIIQGMRALEGEGFLVRRPFPTAQIDHVGPFLLLDEMGPADNAPGEAKGAPDHPHRGFETVTYVLDGEIEHKDSVGNVGLITPGEVQWMTAGAGIVHSEMPSDMILRDGGRVHGFQLWVNLPASAKMHRPRYQDLTREAMPTVDLDGGTAVIIAGQGYGTRGVTDTFWPIDYLHVRLDADRTTEYELDPNRIAFVYAFGGAGHVGKSRQAVRPGAMAVFDTGGGRIPIAAGPAGIDVLIGASAPLNEPVARYGPFVMNTRAEIVQAFEDYQAGRMGEIEPEHTSH